MIGNHTFLKHLVLRYSLFIHHRIHSGFLWYTSLTISSLRNSFIQDDYDAGYLYHCQLSSKDDRFQYNPERQDSIVSTLPVPNTDPAHGEDIPLTSVLVR